MTERKIDGYVHGIYLTLTGAELAAHCENRARLHTELYNGYLKQLEEIRKLNDRAENESEQISKTGRTDNVDTIRNSSKTHERKARFFTFASKHFEADTKYLVGTSDLEYYEIAPSRY
jgi:hypothetical protein